jgi:hypothetical protein
MTPRDPRVLVILQTVRDHPGSVEYLACILAAPSVANLTYRDYLQWRQDLAATLYGLEVVLFVRSIGDAYEITDLGRAYIAKGGQL